MNKTDTCPGYSADIDTEYNRVTENGTKVCGSCDCFKYEDANGYANTPMFPKAISKLVTAPITVGIGFRKLNE